MSPTMRRALKWLAENGPVGAIPVSISLRAVKQLVKAGLARESGKDPGVFGFVTYIVTDAGRAALSTPDTTK